MSNRLKKWLLRFALATTVIAVALTASLAFIVATESGTRWALGKVSAFAPIEVDAAGASGTLLSVLRVPGIRYADEDRTIIVRGIVLRLDWSACSLDDVAIEMLSVGQFSLLNTSAQPVQPKPLEIAMPALPVGIQVSELRVTSLLIDELAISPISISGLGILGKRIEASAIHAGLDAISVDVSQLTTTLDGDVPIAGHAAWRIADTSWSGQANIGGNLGKLTVEHNLAGDFPAHTEGNIELLQRTEPLLDLVSEFDGWRYENWLLGNGSVRIVGTASDYSADLAATIASEDEPLSATVSGHVSGSTNGLSELDLNIETPIAHARASGSVDWAPALGVDILLVTDNLDPSSYIPVAAGAINSEIRFTASSVSDFAVDIVSLEGTWNEQPANGLGRLSRQADTWQCAGCLINVGQNRISVDGELLENQISGNIDVNAPFMHQLWPGLSGSLIGDGRVQGTVVLPRLSGQVAGRQLRFAGWRVASVDVQTSNSTPENIDVRVEVAGLAQGDTALGSGGIQLAGSPQQIAVSTRWVMDEYAAELSAQLSLFDDAIDGRILSADLSEPFTGNWATTEPIGFRYEPGLARMDRGAWVNGDAEFSHEQILITADSITADAKLSNGPLSVLNLALPEQVRVDGFADAAVKLVQEDGKWSGNIEWRQRQTSVLFRSNRGDEILKTVPVAEASIVLNDNAANVQATVNTDSGLRLAASASLADLASDAPFEAAVQLNGDLWDWVPLLFPEIDNVEGILSADVRAAGVASSPDLSGELRWQDGSLAMPALNLPLTGIDITLSGTSSGDMTVIGEAVSGNGPLTVDGRLDNVASASPSFLINISGDQADLLNWPDYKLTASPDLTFAGDKAGVDVSGSVDLDRAEIIIRELPEGAVSPSDDVTVEGRESVTPERTRITGEVGLSLSDNIHIRAFGLDTNLEGQLQFSVPASGEPQAEGEVRLVGGVFEAYGQRLQIEQGTMVFTGPLDDPIINVRAIRRIDGIEGNVTAGIHLTGRAQSLSSTVFADPSMSEADALSYLLTGRPLADATAADGSNLSNTAYSLGLRQAALITNQIGQTVGLDELTVSGSNQNTTELVAGKQINPDLYARYAYGVFTRLGHLLLRYRISKSFSIEIGAGETQSMDILYTIEKQ